MSDLVKRRSASLSSTILFISTILFMFAPMVSMCLFAASKAARPFFVSRASFRAS
ncbi:unnamed protein product [Ectocarpus sp. CCAP 1310/34]|nr:unnamed protein product [Ectocarpus sp. CCAP 1310/34]